MKFKKKTANSTSDRKSNPKTVNPKPYTILGKSRGKLEENPHT
jgi:hypothetical protein